jgi:signal peptidase II
MTKLYIWVAAIALALDQAVKFWVRYAAEGVEGRSLAVLWPNVFELKLVYNEGIAFGMFQGMGVWLAPIAVVIAGGATWYSLRHKHEPRSTHVTMALLCAGALGNLIDRIALGRVTDMFWIRAIEFPVFNVADVCITTAGVMLGLSVVGEFFHKPAPAKAPEEVGEPTSPNALGEVGEHREPGEGAPSDPPDPTQSPDPRP